MWTKLSANSKRVKQWSWSDSDTTEPLPKQRELAMPEQMWKLTLLYISLCCCLCPCGVQLQPSSFTSFYCPLGLLQLSNRCFQNILKYSYSARPVWALEILVTLFRKTVEAFVSCSKGSIPAAALRWRSLWKMTAERCPFTCFNNITEHGPFTFLFLLNSFWQALHQSGLLVILLDWTMA